jgi:hypothetical protein
MKTLLELQRIASIPPDEHSHKQPVNPRRDRRRKEKEKQQARNINCSQKKKAG